MRCGGRWGALVSALLWLGCGGDDGDPADDGVADGTAGPSTTAATESVDGTATDDAEPTSGEAVRPNWHEDIAPLIAEHCRGCHTEGSIAPFAMTDYESTWPLAAAIIPNVESRNMPPWHAVETDECTPPAAFQHDARLSDEQIQMLRDWFDLGTPEGDPANAAPIPDPPSLDLADPTSTVTMQGSINVEPQGQQLDFFHCLSFDPGHTEDVYVDGLQVIPGNDQIVHHVLLYIDVDGASAAWENGQQLDCGGGTGGISNVQLVGGWVPGGRPIETPQDVGVLLPAGARIVYNMHYHASVAGPQVDQGTGVALRYGNTAPQYVSYFELIGAPGVGDLITSPFLIPAGASGHQEEIEYEVPVVGLADVRVWAVLNHMHKVGVDMKVSVQRGAQETCLLQTPQWDFDWQRSYAYDVPIGEAFRVQTGDVVKIRCTYDNTLDNPAVVEALGEVGLTEPQQVSLGEGTLDEMCLAGVGVAIGLP